MKEFPGGVYPVMLTPFTSENKVDYESLGKLVDWYIQSGVSGLFAVCQSSEMFFLSLEERVQITRFVVARTAGRVPVVASGHIGDTLEEQAQELNLIAAQHPDCLILLTNRMAKENESDEVWLENLQKLMERIPGDIPLGFYECPYPYKRVMTEKTVKWCAATGRFYFIKDTSCDMENISMKLAAAKGSSLKLFNANVSTLLDSLQAGAAGFSGVMANFNPEFYVWLCKNYASQPEKAREIADFMTVSSLIERQVYPVNAKYYQKQIGNFATISCRTKAPELLNRTCVSEVDQYMRFVERLKKQYGI